MPWKTRSEVVFFFFVQHSWHANNNSLFDYWSCVHMDFSFLVMTLVYWRLWGNSWPYTHDKHQNPRIIIAENWFWSLLFTVKHCIFFYNKKHHSATLNAKIAFKYCSNNVSSPLNATATVTNVPGCDLRRRYHRVWQSLLFTCDGTMFLTVQQTFMSQSRVTCGQQLRRIWWQHGAQTES